MTNRVRVRALAADYLELQCSELHSGMRMCRSLHSGPGALAIASSGPVEKEPVREAWAPALAAARPRSEPPAARMHCTIAFHSHSLASVLVAHPTAPMYYFF